MFPGLNIIVIIVYLLTELANNLPYGLEINGKPF